MATQSQTPQYETVVDDNIAQVSQKIRLGDLGRGALALACLVFGYALLVAVLDLSLGGSDAWAPLSIRVAAFIAFLFGLGYLGTRVVVRSLTTVNPYYAARQLEDTIPGSKNSIINWLDLKNQSLPPVIHQAVGMKAARVVEDADPELITSPRDLWKLSAAACVLFLGLIVLFAIVPRQFGSLMARAAMPFRPSALKTATTIAILKPGVGDVVVPANQRVDFLARIDGHFPPANSPGAPALLYRYTTNDVSVRLPLEEDNLGQWGVRLSPDQLRTGLYWKITAGDASSPEAQLRVRAQPFVTSVEAQYIYRPYRKLAPETVTMPNESIPQPRLFGHRGTDVVLKARTNSPIKSGSLELEVQGVKKTISAELPASEPLTLAFRIGLEKSGTFRIHFEAADGEKNVDRSPYPIEVLEDGAPFVDLIQPGKDLVAPANGTVLLTGVAMDDFGVTGLSLQLQMKAGAGSRPLAAVPYVPKMKLKFDNGTYPVIVQYSEVLKLDELRTPDSKLVNLKADDEITYWLEATDNFDFGRAHVGKSKSFKITIQDGLQPTKEQTQQRQTIQKEKEQHDNQQAKDHDKQNADTNQQGGKDQNKDGPGNDGQGKGNDQTKGDGNSKDNNPNGNGAKDDGGGGQSGANNQPSAEEQKKNDLENKLAKTAEPISKALDQDNAGKTPPDGSKDKTGDTQNAGGKNPPDAKSDTDKTPNPGKANPKDGTGEKNAGKENANKDTPPGKEGPNKDGPGNEKSSNPNPGAKDDPSKEKVDDKKGGSNSNNGADDKKNDAKSDPDKDKSKGGTGGASQTSPDKSAGGDDPKKDATKKGDDPNGEAKSTNKTGNPDVTEKGKTSDNAKTESSNKTPDGKPRPGEVKGADPKSDPKGESKGEAKAKSDSGKDGPTAEAKAKGGKPGEPETAKEPPSNDKGDDAALAKGNGDKEATKPATKQDIDNLKELLKKGGPEADQAAKDMAKRGQDIKDPGLKKDLENALREAGQMEAADELTGKNRELLPPPQKAGTGPKEAGNVPKDDPSQKQGAEASAPTKSGGSGISDILKKITPEEAFARRMGNLQLDNLDDLKKRVNSDVLKKANVKDDEWQSFLENARKYQDLIKQMRQKDDAKFLRGGAGKIANQGPRRIESSPNATQDPLAGAQAAPPWEFREAQRQFTKKTKIP